MNPRVSPEDTLYLVLKVSFIGMSTCLLFVILVTTFRLDEGIFSGFSGIIFNLLHAVTANVLDVFSLVSFVSGTMLLFKQTSVNRKLLAVVAISIAVAQVILLVVLIGNMG
ncbi:MAG: hypothetical protein JWM00_522 [Candidatus Saccharibacteria bacterium]|nr:hypothetical protein [Candidatus Saccharibacteria bacterium]